MTRPALPFLAKTDPTSRLVLNYPWESTTLGPIDGWPSVLKTTVALIMSSPVPIVTLWGEDGYMIYNHAYSFFAGGRHPLLLGSKVREGWPEVAEFNDNVMKVGLRGETLSYVDQELTLHRNGKPEQVWMNLDYSPIRDDRGEIAGVMSIVVETTAKVRAERSVLAERERLQSMFEQAPGFMALLSGRDHRYVLANRAYRALTGGRSLLGLRVREAVPELAQPGILDQLDRAFEEGVTLRGEAVPLALRNADAEGELTFVDFVLQPIRDSAGIVSGIFVEGSDVTERVHALQALRDSEARFRTFAEAMPTHVWSALPNGELDWFNKQVYDYTGLDNGALLGAGWAAFVHPDDAGAALRLWQACVDSGDAFDIEMRLRRADGQYRWHLSRARPSPVGDGGDMRWIGTSIDIDDQKSAAQQLAAINATLEDRVAQRTADRDRMWKLSKDIMLVAGFDAMLTAVNPAFTNILGWTEADVIGTSFLDLIHPDDLEQTIRQISSLSSGAFIYRFENRYRRKNGTYCTLSWTASPDKQYIHAVGRDISTDLLQADAMRRTEAALQQAQKMETIGKLTGGVAHDFNNLLQVIAGNLQLVGPLVADLPDVQRRLANAMSGVERGAKLASSLLSFARRQPLAPKVVKVNRLLAGMEDMMRRSLGEEVEIETVISGGLWTTEVDVAQLENAILNLAINARDAMDGHGKLTIELNNASLDAAYAQTHQEVVPGQYVMLAVSDTGSGMAPEVMAQAFEPFFSTKPEGKGTGLGLSMVYGLVKQSGGHIKIYSEPGEGTTVKIYLPRSYQTEDNLLEPGALPAVGGTETILVAEDDEQVRLTVVDMLTDLGYRVLKASDAASALNVIDSGIPIDVLFTDVVMPGPLRSPDLARKARERLPDIAVLFTSGYTENAIVHGGRLDAGVELLGKPYTRESLAKKIRHVLHNQQEKKAIAHGTPAAPAAAAPSPGVAPQPEQKEPASILLVEDDDDIRNNTADLMRILGYQVIEAASSEAALQLLEQRQPDVVLTDMGLTGMQGDELVARIKQRWPAIKVALVTGSAQTRHAADGVLMKPFTSAQLADLIASLSAAGSRAS